MRKMLLLLVPLTLFAISCGGGDDSSGTPVSLSGSTQNKGTKDLTGTSIELELDDFYFEPTFIKGGTPGAKVTLHLKNEGKQPHTFTSSAFGLDETVDPGGTKDVEVTLPQSGATEYHCRFHQQSNGMQGAFFFKDGDTVGAAGGPGSSSSSSSADSGGYYN